MADTNEILSNCVKNLKTSVELIDNSLKLLQESTRTVPKLKRILETRKHFDLVPEVDYENAKEAVTNELQPQIDMLKLQFNNELKKLEKRKSILYQRVQIKRDKLQKFERMNNNLDKDKLDRFRFLRHKKKRLIYSLTRLKSQERKKRLSLGIQPSLHPDS
ncbi:DASH complex subunit Spc19p [[Candida] jaroonii]|uniref:DASH complex subunit Spc19p n=1 Tax=[Candida] jaroonii TaxID=467808 RepID=A0ACA9Y1I4_9ASCO|nr:DASH complex subunit Spc19p [[Candida] jaroonii]